MTRKKQAVEPEEKCTITTTEYVSLNIPTEHSPWEGEPYQTVRPTTKDLSDFLYAVWTKFGPQDHEVNVSRTGLIVTRRVIQ